MSRIIETSEMAIISVNQAEMLAIKEEFSFSPNPSNAKEIIIEVNDIEQLSSILKISPVLVPVGFVLLHIAR